MEYTFILFGIFYGQSIAPVIGVGLFDRFLGVLYDLRRFLIIHLIASILQIRAF